MSDSATQLVERITQPCPLCSGLVTDEDITFEPVGDPVGRVCGTLTCPHCGHIETKDFPYQQGRFLARGATVKARSPRRPRLPADTVVIHAGGYAYIPGPLLDRAGIATDARVRILAQAKQLVLRRPDSSCLPGVDDARSGPRVPAIRSNPRARGARFAVGQFLRTLGVDPKTIRGPHPATAFNDTVRIFFPELLKEGRRWS